MAGIGIALAVAALFVVRFRLKANKNAQVLDTNGRPIPALYCAGETMGLYHQGYRGGTSVMRGAVFGRIAGLTHAASLPAN